MLEVTSHSAADYLRTAGRAAPDEPIMVRELAGGVSNVVLLVELPARGERYVLKQARARLRVQHEWLCPVERIWREVAVLRICQELLPTNIPDHGGQHPTDEVTPLLPQVLWEDRENYLYAMTAAPDGHHTWKELLLAGETDPRIATACARLLGALHAGSWNSAAVAAQIGERTFFDQLRLDPYYRQIARVHSDLAPAIGRLIDSVWQHRRCLVHGDYSPKNLLVWPHCLLLIDFEVGHFGDPAFDLGFFLSHLVLKSVWAGDRLLEYLGLASAFVAAYRTIVAATGGVEELAQLEQRMLMNLAGCLLARVDGKSPVDYLSFRRQQTVRSLARAWLSEPPQGWSEAVEQCALVLSAEN